MSKTLPALRFRVYPKTASGLYFLVYVWRTKHGLRAAGRRHRLPRPDKMSAFTTIYRIRRYRANDARTLPLCGEIHFCERWLSAEVISHECGHAALGWAERVGLIHGLLKRDERAPLMAGVEEEDFCQALGVMAQQCVTRFYKARILQRS